MGGGITNHHLITYSLSNIYAKNYQNRFMCVEVRVCYIIVVFLRHSVYTCYRVLQACVRNTNIRWRAVSIWARRTWSGSARIRVSSSSSRSDRWRLDCASQTSPDARTCSGLFINVHSHTSLLARIHLA